MTIIKALPDPICFADFFSLRNAIIGDSNFRVSAALGCNFNAQPIISTDSSYNSLFYIVGYMIKDSMKPSKLLGFVKSAKESCQKIRGSAPEGEDPMTGDSPIRRVEHKLYIMVLVEL